MCVGRRALQPNAQDEGGREDEQRDRPDGSVSIVRSGDARLETGEEVALSCKMVTGGRALVRDDEGSARSVAAAEPRARRGARTVHVRRYPRRDLGRCLERGHRRDSGATRQERGRARGPQGSTAAQRAAKSSHPDDARSQRSSSRESADRPRSPAVRSSDPYNDSFANRVYSEVGSVRCQDLGGRRRRHRRVAPAQRQRGHASGPSADHV